MASRELEQLLNKKQDRLETVPNALTEKVRKSQVGIMNEIRILLESFERDENGNIFTSPLNVQKIGQLKNQLQQILFRSEYAVAVREFAKEFDNQADLNSEFFGLSVEYTESAVTSAMIQQAKKTTVDLLLGGALDSAFYNPVVDVINSAVSTNAGFVETVKSLRVQVLGGETATGVVEGRLLRYTKQIASDAFAISDRTYGNQVNSELSLEFYRYVGGLIEETRDFCKVRNNKFYHKAEVESWLTNSGSEQSNPVPRGEWEGQYRGTNSASIFQYCGGYNCKHTLMPVSIAAVPKDVLIRNVENGNIELSEKQKQVLGLT